MRKSDFHFDLPDELIAQRPASPRTSSRLLHIDAVTGVPIDRQFFDLPQLLAPGDLLVLNNTRVIPARLYGAKETGGRVEVLIERVLGTNRALAQMRASKSSKPGQRLLLEEELRATVLGRKDEFYELVFDIDVPLAEVLERYGHVPLPPYIARSDTPVDRERYQTVYARDPGAVAAPTAGLHFDNEMFDRLKALGVECVFVTLHVGAGTFQPLRAEEIEGQRLHAESVHVSAATCAAIERAHAQGRRVVAVGTTVVRALETAAEEGTLAPYEGETDIFIYPGYRFRVVDALITNFHLPESSLLMLVCAFAGTERVLDAYRHAVQQRYRFYSYGDAMFVSRVGG
ncbi:MAG: tRNA preQ1(34) S-adenosylmethionine ribosyltransferase-isomerase QueA [Gammaproteobacteria bacterium]|nr:tRNA preQ1(34) S-adenosylmethionine ribosyltransferase-isomerase QueA [Gammaproteobacteria bacterium]